MTRRRWIADEINGDTAALTGDHAAHLSRTLRAEVGQQFDIAIRDTVRRGTISAISADRVEFRLGEEVDSASLPPVTLVLAIFKFDRLEWAIEKCTEIGVARVIPVIAHRTDSHLAAAAAKRGERWQRIARQAAEQSRRTAPPEIAAPVKLKDLPATLSALPEAGRAAPRIVLAESGGDILLREALPSDADGVTLAVGPEGGWTDVELQWFHDSGWLAASLGDTILRAETAAIVATALALDALR